MQARRHTGCRRHGREGRQCPIHQPAPAQVVPHRATATHLASCSPPATPRQRRNPCRLSFATRAGPLLTPLCTQDWQVLRPATAVRQQLGSERQLVGASQLRALGVSCRGCPAHFYSIRQPHTRERHPRCQFHPRLETTPSRRTCHRSRCSPAVLQI